ncbi:hypothetical protein Tco_0988252 [Tanacetum coccineum]|uniref:Uncharacterized protein n=1 Tax=Tanacetum coccineum TaxID=301880 RepID=A0ABQ5EQU5_9ASTR
MVRDTIQLEDAISTISQEYLLEFTSEYGIPESLHPELPGLEEPIVEFLEGKVGVYTKFFEFENFRWMSFSKQPGKNTPHCYTKPLDSLKNWNNRFFWVYEKILPTVVEWGTNAPKDEMPSADSYSAADVTTLNTCRTLIQKQPEALLCLVGLSRNYFLGDDVYGLVQLDQCPESYQDMDDTIATSESSGIPSALEKFSLDFANENLPPPLITKKDGMEEQVHDGLSSEIPPVENPTVTEETPTDVRDSGPLSYAKPQLHPERDVAHKAATEIPTGHIATTEVQGQIFAESPESGKSASFSSAGGSPRGIFQLEWGVINNCRLDTPDACQDMVDHIVPPGYFSKLRHLSDTDFLSQYNVNLARQVAMGSQLRLRFEQEVRLLKKATAKIAKRDQRIKAREEEIERIDQELKSLRTVETELQGLRNQTRNLETLLARYP